jgi:hypothetical protein
LGCGGEHKRQHRLSRYPCRCLGANCGRTVTPGSALIAEFRIAQKP